jgi:hypothetical protein
VLRGVAVAFRRPASSPVHPADAMDPSRGRAMVTVEEQRAVQEENAKGDERFLGVMRDMGPRVSRSTRR